MSGGRTAVTPTSFGHPNVAAAVCPLYARAMPDDHHLLINSGNEMPVNGYDHCAVYYKTTVLNRSSYLSE